MLVLIGSHQSRITVIVRDGLRAAGQKQNGCSKFIAIFSQTLYMGFGALSSGYEQ